MIRLIENPFLDPGGVKRQERRLTMADQWQLWRRRFWRYKESIVTLVPVPPALVRIDAYTYVGHPATIAQIKAALLPDPKP